MTHKDILHFWRNIEIFDLPDLDTKKMIPLDSLDRFPWEINHTSKPDKKRVYTLFFGKVKKKYVIDQIEKLLPTNEEILWEEKANGFTCFSSIVLDENGRPDSKSYTLASYVLGIDILQKKKDISLVHKYLQDDTFNDYLERFNIFKETDEENPKGDVVNWEYIEKEINYLNELTSWNQAGIKVYFIQKEIHKKAQVEPQFLNSFLLDDLNRLIDGNIPLSPTVEKYLTLQPKQKRYDLIKQKEYLFNTINPKQLTEGRWPSTPKYGLCTAQLGAINTIFKELEHTEGIQGVNGPPGTGKTTLLLDVIAQIVVDRAKAVLNLGIDNIFGEYEKISDYVHTYKLHHTLQKNYGIVVASNNNSAVENISKELPQAKKINKYERKNKKGEKIPPAFPKADYFGKYAKKELTGEENWGILAAALGNSTNKNKFNNLFWKSNEDNFYDYLAKEQNLQEQHKKNFEIVKKEFNALLDEFKVFKNLAIDFHDKFNKYQQNISSEKQLRQSKLEIEKNKNNLDVELQQLRNRKKEVEDEKDALKASLETINTRRPIFFFIQKLFNTQAFKKWNDEISQILNDFNHVLSELKQLNSQVNKSESEKNNLSNQIQNIDLQLNEIEKFKSEYDNLKKQLIDDYEIKKENIFDKSFYDKDLKDIHLLSPYHSEKVAKLRSDIFLKALDVHKFVILSNAKQFKNNLNAFFEMILGKVKISEELAGTLWDTFFFCIPVISTSLASAGRLFPNINQNQIGWLLIDEAGQATPQSAVGLIQRSKRCVIVGDPLQVEPVVTIPKSLVNNLKFHHQVESVWSPYNTSVQQLADRISKYGTLMGNEENSIWTGFPLRTHRRCFNPMFDIANKIAYDDQMVKGTNDENEHDYIGTSCWFNISGSGVGDSQVIREEINLLKEKINELINNKYTGEIYVISPFKLVGHECKKVLKSYDNVQCGTIHTFQGKEADVVFIILGSQPEKEGTRRWASLKPNMLNVALTRAKKRCYVIGNINLWQQQPYFDVMSKELRVEDYSL